MPRAAKGAGAPSRRRWRSTFAGEAPTAELWERIEADLGADPKRRRLPRFPERWRRAVAAALAFLVMGAGLYGVGLHGTATLQAEVMEESAQELLTFVESRRPVDVASGDPEELRHWLRGRVAFDPPRPPVPEGLELTGARLCYFLDRRIAAYMYAADGDVLSLYVMDSTGLATPRGDLVPLADALAAIDQAGDLNSLFWHDEGLAFTLVSTVPRARLVPLATALARDS